MESAPHPVGRNEPCPCGSGRKWKQCHGRLAVRAPSLLDGRAAREAATEKLMRHARRAEYVAHAQLAWQTFWGERGVVEDEGLARMAAIPNVQGCLFGYLAADLALPDGRSLVERFLAKHSRELLSEERAYLEALSSSAVGIYEVLEVRRDRGFLVKDLWRGSEIELSERALTSQVRPFHLLAARLIQGGDGTTQIEGVWVFAAQDKQQILARLEAAAREPGTQQEDERAFFRRVTPLFQHLWIELVAERPLPRLETTTGERMVWCTVRFELLDRARLETALDAAGMFARDEDGGWTWSEPWNGSESISRTLGRLRIGDGVMELETQSRARATRGRALLEQLAPGAIEFAGRREKDMQRALEQQRRQRTEAPPPAVEEMGDEAREMLRRVIDQHYRSWPDHPLPALEGRTPRQAASSEPHRVVQLLKVLESSGTPGIDYDFAWLWQELGLQRPGPGQPRPS